MTHVILTGAAGFVGSHILRHLLTETDWTISCPLTFGHRGTPARVNQQMRWNGVDPSVEWENRVNFECCDLAAPIDPVTAHRLGIDRARVILNVASESHVDRSIDQPVAFVQNNVNLILQTLELARQAPNLEAFVQVSTDEVYGPAPGEYNSREWDPIIPSNPYSASKAAQEAIAISYWRTYGIPLILTNTMNIVGEMQNREKFLPSIIRKVLHGEQVTIHARPTGDDTWEVGSRFYLHARNQADALLFLTRLALANPDSLSAVEGQDLYSSLRYDGSSRPPRYNIVGEQEMSNLELASLIATTVRDLTGTPIPEGWATFVDFHSSRPGHDLRYALDGSKLAGLGWKHPVPLVDSIKKTVQWTLEHPEWLH